METIYLIICESELVHYVTGESLCKITSVYGAYKTREKAEENKAWYEKCRKEADGNSSKDKIRFYIEETTLE